MSPPRYHEASGACKLFLYHVDEATMLSLVDLDMRAIVPAKIELDSGWINHVFMEIYILMKHILAYQHTTGRNS